MKAEFINPFIKATIETYTNMLATSITMGKPMLKERSNCTADIAGVIGLTGELTGAVVMAYSEDSILKSVSVFIGEEMPEMNDDIQDALGELVNVVAGCAKQFLVGAFDISLPTVKGGAFDSFFPPEGPIVSIPMNCTGLPPFELLIGYQA